MKVFLARLALGVVLFAAPLVTRAQADDAPPSWAYAVNPPDFKVQPDDGTPRHVPDSTAAFTVTQAQDLFFALDWHPSDHPPLPDIVADGRKPDVMACGVCRRADGPGGPENASLAGLPAQYIVQQMADFKSGARTTSVPQRVPPQLMIKTAKNITDPEIEQGSGNRHSTEDLDHRPRLQLGKIARCLSPGGFWRRYRVARPGPSLAASSRFRKIWNVLRCGMRGHISSPTCRPAALNRVGNSPTPEATERVRHARSVMGTG
jgi:cytochrome c553